jgi:hypothetical protein
MYRVIGNVFRIGITIIIAISVSACNDQTVIDFSSETNVDFVERYINTVGEKTSSGVYKEFWGERANKYVLDDPEKVAREIRNAAAMHIVLLNDKTLSTVPEVNNWEDSANTTTFLYTLNQPVTLMLPGYPNSGNAPWTGYQITVERENDRWVVSGESLSR